MRKFLIDFNVILTNMVYIIHKTPKILSVYGVGPLQANPACPPHVGKKAESGIPSLRIARRVPPTPGGSFNQADLWVDAVCFDLYEVSQ